MLNERQRKFVDAYVLFGNQEKAALHAGYSKTTARSMAARLLANVGVAEAVEKKRGQLTKKFEITAENVLFETARVAFSDIADFVEFGPDGVVFNKAFADLPAGATKCIAEAVHHFNAEGGGTGKLKLHNKLDALKMLGAYFGLWDGAGARKTPVNPVEEMTYEQARGRLARAFNLIVPDEAGGAVQAVAVRGNGQARVSDIGASSPDS